MATDTRRIMNEHGYSLVIFSNKHFITCQEIAVI